MEFVYEDTGRNGTSFACPLTALKCRGQTKSGAACTRWSVKGVPYCWQHLLSKKNLRVFPSREVPGQLGLFASTTAKPSDGDGDGDGDDDMLFDAGDTIVRYFGERKTKAEIDARYGRRTAPYTVQVGGVRGDKFIDAACVRGAGAYANHHRRRNNTEFVASGNNVLMVATKPIYDGDEILVDYGAQYNLRERNVDYKTRLKSKSRSRGRSRGRGR